MPFVYFMVKLTIRLSFLRDVFMSAKPWRTIAILALPVALQTLLQALLGMADVAMVTGLGAQAVAAVGLSAKLHFLLLVLMIGVATAGSILIAQYTGARDTH
jgi:Na+-driven multidrug efflux pump